MQKLFTEETCKTVHWMEMAEVKLGLARPPVTSHSGNDDEIEIDEVDPDAKEMELAEGRVPSSTGYGQTLR